MAGWLDGCGVLVSKLGKGTISYLKNQYYQSCKNTTKSARIVTNKI